MSHLLKISNSISHYICWVSVAGLSVMMFLTFADVILRYFGFPIVGSYDIVGICGAFVLALPIAYTQVLKGHVGIDFIIIKFPKALQKSIDVINHSLNIFIYFLLAWQCSVYGKKLWTVGRVSETLQIPIFPFPYIVGLGCALMCTVLIIELFYLFRKAEEK